jgi:formylglycine-generating enzyme required for sulfatase activity
MKNSGDFAQLLRRCRAGEVSHTDLLAAVDVLLRQPGTDMAGLLETLASEDRDARSPLPLSLVFALLHKINGAREGNSATESDATWYRAADPTLTVVSGTVPRGAGIQPPPDKPDREIGRTLKGRFELLERLGHGGMSTVYKAVDRRKSEALLSEPNVAVKIIRAELAEHPDMFAVLQRETHKAQSLGHPNIIRVFDCDRDGETVFMTMEYLAGASLGRRLARARDEGLPKGAALAIIGDIASGLAFAHRNGVVHGDLKPSNVIITDAGEVKVIDFGIARLLPFRAAETKPTATGEQQRPLSAVTPAYASPEMLEGKEPDPRDDVYALACVAYTLLTGRHPFDREASNLARDAKLRPAPHRKLTRAQFKALAAALAFERERRTPTVERLIAELRPRSRARKAADLVLGTAVAAAVIVLGIIVYTGIYPGDARESSAIATAAAAGATADTFRDCDVCPRMKTVPAGSFVQGLASAAEADQPAEAPARLVTIGAPFAIGAHETTLAEYAVFAEETARESTGCAVYDGDWQSGAAFGWRDTAYVQAPSHPVACVSWDDARAYSSWLSAKTGRRYRLPSASEWEYAARGGAAEHERQADPRTACGNGNVADRAAAERYDGWTVHDCTDGYVYTAPVGSFAPNPFGLYDMVGNVFEWVDDCWHDDYRGAPTDGAAWGGGDCSLHELRGGSWFTAPSLANSVTRNRFAADYRSNSFGFRVVREIADAE